MNTKVKKQKTESQHLTSFKVYMKTAAILTDDKQKQIRIADEVFTMKYGFSWISQFEEAFNKLIKKDIIMVNEGADVAERHETEEKTSQGLNKGVAPEGFLNKGDLCKLLNDLFGCPSSLTESLLKRYFSNIRQTSYPNEIEIAGCCRVVDVPCYKTEDVVKLLNYVTRSASQKLTKKNEPSCMCYFPALEMKFKFDLEAFREIQNDRKSA